MLRSPRASTCFFASFRVEPERNLKMNIFKNRICRTRTADVLPGSNGGVPELDPPTQIDGRFELNRTHSGGNFALYIGTTNDFTLKIPADTALAYGGALEAGEGVA